MAANGWNAKREFYYNDAGVQIENLASSTQARAKGSSPATPTGRRRPSNGDYIAEVANAYLRGDAVRSRPRRRRQGRRRRPRRDPASSPSPTCAASRTTTSPPTACRSTFTSSNPRSTPTAGGRDRARTHRPQPHLRRRRRAVAAHHRFRRRQGPGDAQVRRHLTYFVPDIAYHYSKWTRWLRTRHHRARRRPPRFADAGEGRAAGAGRRHPARLSRLRAAPDGDGDARRRGSEAVQARRQLPDPARPPHRREPAATPRAGSWSRKPDSQLTFDIDLARSQSLDNPV